MTKASMTVDGITVSLKTEIDTERQMPNVGISIRREGEAEGDADIWLNMEEMTLLTMMLEGVVTAAVAECEA